MLFLWNEAFYKPIYNFLVWIMDFLPGHDFGWAIIVVTVVIKALMFIPAQKGIRSQRAMQKLQPEIQKLKEKYKNDQKLLAQKTMELYKNKRVSPLGSCLPLLIQFPILIALFFVTRDGLQPDPGTLYASLEGFDFNQVNTMFLGVLDLINSSPGSRYVMPILIGVLQFGQMYRMQLIKGKAPVEAKKGPGPNPQMMQKMMTYFMPVFIAFIASSYPAGLSLYWVTSTLFTIGQQEALMYFQKD